jgi:hypothetical protein
MDKLTAILVVPALAVLYGIVLGGERGALAGFAVGVVAGVLLLYAPRGAADRLETLEREVAELRRTQQEDN